MPTEIAINEVKAYLTLIQGREITLSGLRKEFNILPGTKSYDTIRTIMYRLVEQRIIRPSGKKDGTYKVITQVEPVPVFSVHREIRPSYPLIFPKDRQIGQEMDFAEDVIIREGDLILVSGVSNQGKTAVCLNFLAENIDKEPILMGNEYTTWIDENYKPTPRFLTRLEAMDWVNWVDDEGMDKMTLLPVRDDYAEHIVRDRLNIIDWINIATGEHYMIGNLLESIKKELGRGVAIVAIQKAEGADAGRGGQFTKDFADLELLVDKLGKQDVLLTIGKCKEFNRPVSGRHFGYAIHKGVKIMDFREVKRCPKCKGKGYNNDGECDDCISRGWVNA